jgi:hypothetical protein
MPALGAGTTSLGQLTKTRTAGTSPALTDLSFELN